jgi:hypothetical protein
MSGTTKLSGINLRKQSWFDYQLLQMAQREWFYVPSNDRILIRGVLVYVFFADISSPVFYDFNGDLGSLGIPILNLNGFSTNTTVIKNQFMPYIFIALHKVLDTIAEWVIDANGPIPWGFKSKIRRFKDLCNNHQSNLPSFFMENLLIQDAYIRCYEIFTEFRNQAAHKSGITVDQFGTMAFAFEDGSTKYITSKDMGEALVFASSLIDCLSDLEESLEMEIAKRKTYLSAKGLSNFHQLELPFPSPAWWSRIYFGFNKTPDEIQETKSVQIDLDAIKQLVFSHNKPAENENARLEVSIHLEDPYSQANYVVSSSMIEKGGVISIGQDALLSNNNDVSEGVREPRSIS